MRTLYIVASVIAVIGAINWGLIGLLGFNLVSALFGAGTDAEKFIYVLVGLSGLVLLYILQVFNRKWL